MRLFFGKKVEKSRTFFRENKTGVYMSYLKWYSTLNTNKCSDFKSKSWHKGIAKNGNGDIINLVSGDKSSRKKKTE